jgi:hypothetical protein
MNFEIKVTGSGTIVELQQALRELVNSIEGANQNGATTFEDSVLYTELSIEA